MHDALFQQGIAALQAGDYRSAIESFSELTRQFPERGHDWFLLGAAWHGAAKLTEAKTAFARAIALDPQHLEAHFALAAVSLALGDAHTALQASQQAVGLAPGDPQAHTNLAIAQEACQQWPQALASYDRALQLDATFADALKNRGALLASTGRLEEAIANNRRYASLYPNRFDAHFNLGDACLTGALFEESARAFTKAIELRPSHARAHLHCGCALAMAEQFEAAQRHLDRAAQLDAQEVLRYREIMFGRDRTARPRLDARTLFLLRHFEHMEQCDWASRQHFLQRFAALIETGAPLTDMALAFRAMAMGLPGQIQLALARQIAQDIADRIETGATANPETGRAEKRHPRPQKIRIAYLSPDFRVHAMGMLAHSLYARHNRAEFEVFGYALGGNDGSALRRQIIDGFDHFTDLDPLDDAAAAQTIAADQIDLLIDLAGYLNQVRPGILARRPAPLQCSWAGYIAPSGAPWIDYLIGDTIAFPNGCDPDFSEALVRLDRCLLFCSYAHDPIKPAPERRLAGLPQTGLVLAAMHNPYKIDPEIFALWMRLLAALPDSVLWLVQINATACGNLRKSAKAQGIDPNRLVFTPFTTHGDHLARLQLADLALDTPQCNGVTTTADALTAGIPVLTCPGKTPIQRMGASLLCSAGLDELIASDLAQYESLALDVLGHPQKLIRLKQKLRAARSNAPFFQLDRWVCHYENALQQIWQRHCAGLPPAPLNIRAETCP